MLAQRAVRCHLILDQINPVLALLQLASGFVAVLNNPECRNELHYLAHRLKVEPRYASRRQNIAQHKRLLGQNYLSLQLLTPQTRGPAAHGSQRERVRPERQNRLLVVTVRRDGWYSERL